MKSNVRNTIKSTTVLTIFLLNSIYVNAQFTQWAKQFGIAQNTYGYSITRDHVGNLYLLGEYNSPYIVFGNDTLNNNSLNGLNFAAYVVKLSDTGKVIWAKNVGSNGLINTTFITSDANGNVYISGEYFNHSIVFGNDTFYNADITGITAEIFLAKLDSSGNLQWARSGHDSGTDWINHSLTDAKGNTYLCGSFSSKALSLDSTTILTNADTTGKTNDLFIIKYNTNGKVAWAKRAGGIKEEDAYGITFDQKGNIIVSGGISSASVNFGSISLTNPYNGLSFLLKIDTSGNFIWVKQAGSQDITWEYSICCSKSGNIYACGQFSSYSLVMGHDTLINYGTVGTSDDLFVARYDSSGNILWARSAGGSDEESPMSILTDSHENIFVGGNYSSPSLYSDNYTISNNGSCNIFLIKYDSSGVNLSSKNIGGTGNDKVYNIVPDSYDNLFMCGSFNSPSLLLGKDTLGSNFGNLDAFVSMYYHDTFLKATQMVFSDKNEILLYPNPGNGHFHLRSSKPIQENQVKIYNTMGIGVKFNLHQSSNQVTEPYDYELDVNNITGIYFLYVTNRDVSNKLIFEIKN